MKTLSDVLEEKSLGSEAVRDRFDRYVKDILNANSKEDFNWVLLKLVPKSVKDFSSWNLDKQKEYMMKRAIKVCEKEVKKFEENCDRILSANSPIDTISISVDWNKNRTWGMCPKAFAVVDLMNSFRQEYISERITGCGYDKHSTAIADALNKCDEVTRLLMFYDNNNITVSDGLRIGIMPYLHGGCGVNSFMSVFDRLGFEFRTPHSTDNFDFHLISRK